MPGRSCVTSFVLFLGSYLSVSLAADPVASLRGALGAAQVVEESWGTFGEHRVADDEGGELHTVHGSLDLCKQVCATYPGCRSFAYCAGNCFLKDGEVTSSSPSHSNDFCTTYYLNADAAATTTAAPAPVVLEEGTCYAFEAALEMNEGQKYAGNPESGGNGFVDLLLCTNGTMRGGLTVNGVVEEIIATHIHHCKGGHTPQKRTGVLCSGPPVINFCGSNAAGLIADGTDYPAPCTAVDSAGASRTEDMRGAFVEGQEGVTVAQRVRDIADYPDRYYFNVHTLSSYNNFWGQGMVRGELQAKPIANGTTTPAPEPDAPMENRCYSFFSQMAMNELQQFPENPDTDAAGYIDLLLCTNGTLRGTALMFGGLSNAIAMHVHRCEGGDTPQTRTSDLCVGDVVINFCGDNSPGLIANGAKYPEPCAKHGSNGAARTTDMTGVGLADGGSQSAVAELVQDIAENPQLYYFNVHSLASFNQWYPRHSGMCRGPIELSSS